MEFIDTFIEWSSSIFNTIFTLEIFEGITFGTVFWGIVVLDFLIILWFRIVKKKE